MPWVRFTRSFDFYPAKFKGRVCIAYKAGMSLNVTRACAERAEAAGAAERCERPRRKPADGKTS